MQLLGQFPPGCARNCDFVDRTRYTVGLDEKVIDLQVELEDLPAVGSLVIHQETVASMVALLGWRLEDPAARDELLRVVALNEQLHEENRALRQALAKVGRQPTEIPRVMAS